MRLNKFTITKIGMGLAALASAGVVALGVSACGSSGSKTEKNTKEITTALTTAENVLRNDMADVQAKVIAFYSAKGSSSVAEKEDEMFKNYKNGIESNVLDTLNKNVPFVELNASLNKKGFFCKYSYTKGAQINFIVLFNGVIISGLNDSMFHNKTKNDTGQATLKISLQYAKLDIDKKTVITKYTPEEMVSATVPYIIKERPPV